MSQRQAIPLYEIAAVASAVDAGGTQDQSTKDLAKIHQQKSVQRGLERFIKRRHLDKAKLPEPFVVELLRNCPDSGGVVLEPVPMILPHEFLFYLYNERRCDFTDRI